MQCVCCHTFCCVLFYYFIMIPWASTLVNTYSGIISRINKFSENEKFRLRKLLVGNIVYNKPTKHSAFPQTSKETTKMKLEEKKRKAIKWKLCSGAIRELRLCCYLPYFLTWLFHCVFVTTIVTTILHFPNIFHRINKPNASPRAIFNFRSTFPFYTLDSGRM